MIIETNTDNPLEYVERVYRKRLAESCNHSEHPRIEKLRCWLCSRCRTVVKYK